MTTITGKIESAAGETLHATLLFTSLSTPQFPPGIVQTNTVKRALSNSTTGLFSILLAAGNYRVSVKAKGLETTFTIAVPSGNSTFSIEELVTTTPAILPGDPPNQLWNGTVRGHITFDPIDNAPFPNIPTNGTERVTYAGANICNGDSYTYAVTYETQEGETALVDFVTYSSPVDAGKAVRVPLIVSPERVINKRIWRSYVSPIGTSPLRLLAEVGPAVSHYDDWETHTQFAARNTTADSPSYNTTAGKIFSTAGQDILLFSTSGLRCLAAASFDQVATLKNGLKLEGSANSIFWRNGSAPIHAIIQAQSPGGMQIQGTQIQIDGGGLALILEQGKVKIVNSGEGAGKVLTSDAVGFASWQTPSTGLSGSGSPEGAVTASPGATYLRTSDESFWVKKTGTGNTGWIQLIG